MAKNIITGLILWSRFLLIMRKQGMSRRRLVITAVKGPILFIKLVLVMRKTGKKVEATAL